MAIRSDAFILWEVDVQRDFVLPGGKLYAPGAEKLLPNIQKLTDAARHGQVFLVSSGDFHSADDPEFKQFPPHCMKGTPGADLLPEALTEKVVRVENASSAKIPADLSRFQQILLEKQTLDIFQTLHAEELVDRLGARAEFVVFGAVTEYCVACAVKGLLARKRRVAVVEDAIQTLDAAVGAQALAEFQQLGARLVTTEKILAEISA
jgi:nicotinamidase/pyrazinamidase